MIKIEENLPDGKSRISLSMKYCSQADGKDRDPNGFEAEADDKRKGPKKSGDHLMSVCLFVCVCVCVCVLFVCRINLALKWIFDVKLYVTISKIAEEKLKQRKCHYF